MSIKHPIIAVTGSSGAGTTTVMKSFAHIFRREGIKAQVVEGDCFHRYNRVEMREAMQDAERAATGELISHFGPEANLLEELGDLFRSYGASGRGSVRRYLHDAREAAPYEAGARHVHRLGTMMPRGTDLLFYEGLHGAVRRRRRRHGASTPTCWSASCRSSTSSGSRSCIATRRMRGYSQEAVIDTILRRMPDYVNYICPQFARTHVNFQRVPTVDTSNPFIARYIPSADESFDGDPLRQSEGHRLSVSAFDAARLVHERGRTTSWCRAARWELAMQLIFTPMILQLIDRKTPRTVEADRPTHERPSTTSNHSRRRRQLCDALRILAVDAVQAARAGTRACRWAWPRSRSCCGAAS